MHGTLHLISISLVALLFVKHHELLLFFLLSWFVVNLKVFGLYPSWLQSFSQKFPKTSFLSNHVPPILAFDIIFSQSTMNDGDCVLFNLAQVVVDLEINKEKMYEIRSTILKHLGYKFALGKICCWFWWEGVPNEM